MKLILKQYVEGLKERGELDAILPALLSELGFHVLSHPGIGTRQAGVDVAAVGLDDRDGNKEKLFLFVIKPGDMKRSDWDSHSPQSVRPTINEILDSYIPTRIPEEYNNHEIVICLCLGGETKENVATQWTNFQRTSAERNGVCFREWNGDKLANLLLAGVLKQDLLPENFSNAFQKSVAMVDQPDVSYRFFAELVSVLGNHEDSERIALTRLRQLYVCLWVLYVWGREAGNLDAPYRASELALLTVWDSCRKLVGKKDAQSTACYTVFEQTLKLHVILAADLLDCKIAPFTDKHFALSMAINSHSSVDVNLALYDLLGRVSLHGIWKHLGSASQTSCKEREEVIRSRNQSLDLAIRMINSNPGLLSPIRDDFAIEIALFMLLAHVSGRVGDVSGFLIDLAHRLSFAIKRRGAFPITSQSYHDLMEHPVDRSDEYLKKNTEGSTLYPLLIAWLDVIGEVEARDQIAKVLKENLPHCTQQVWLPDADTEEVLWSGNREHGVTIPALDLSDENHAYSEVLRKACEDHSAIDDISAIRVGLWPIFLLACRHYRMPVPPQLWFYGGTQDEADNASES